MHMSPPPFHIITFSYKTDLLWHIGKFLKMRDYETSMNVGSINSFQFSADQLWLSSKKYRWVINEVVRKCCRQYIFGDNTHKKFAIANEETIFVHTWVCNPNFCCHVNQCPIVQYRLLKFPGFSDIWSGVWHGTNGTHSENFCLSEKDIIFLYQINHFVKRFCQNKRTWWSLYGNNLLWYWNQLISFKKCQMLGPVGSGYN